MNVLDYDIAHLTLCRDDFKDKRRFEGYCEFMCESKDADIIEIPIDLAQVRIQYGESEKTSALEMGAILLGIYDKTELRLIADIISNAIQSEVEE